MWCKSICLLLIDGVVATMLGCGGAPADSKSTPPEFEGGSANPNESSTEGPTFPDATSAPYQHDRTFTFSANGGASASIPSASASFPETAPATEPTDELSELDRKLAQLKLGSIAFNTPETIAYGEAATIELLASLKEAEESLRQAVRGDGPVDSARVQLGDRMEARLTGTGFRIEAITPETQAVSHQQRTLWRWEIEPTRPADLELHLTLSAIFKIDGESVTRTIQTFERTIYVEVPLAKRVQNFVAGNYQFIGSAFVIPIVGALYHRHRKKRRAAAVSASRVERRAA